MENEAPEVVNASGLFSAAAISSEETNTQLENKNEIGDFTVGTVSGCQTRPESEGIAAQTIEPLVKMASKENQIVYNFTENKPEHTKDVDEFCNLKLESLLLLKDSTKKLLCLIDELQTKSSSTKPIPTNYAENNLTIPMLQELTNHLEELPETSSLKKLETHIKEIDKANFQTVHDCTIFERLTRKCICLNRKEFNDLTIHFNEDTKYSTSHLGEIIKNIRIVKKFLYMGSEYSKNALMFLNEGLTKCPHSERVDILLACSHADICNVFDDDSFVKILIRGPIQYETFGDATMQSLAARVLYRIAVVEEGRRYLNFNSKIPNDIKQMLRKNSGNLNADTTEFLNTALNLLSPSTVPLINASYYCKADEGMTKKILNSLQHFRVFMTTEEILTNLQLLNKLCDSDRSISDMRQNLKSICIVFKELLLLYDDSEMNVLIISIINKLTVEAKNKDINSNKPKTYTVGDVATEPTEMKHQLNQVPSKNFKNLKKAVKSRLGLNMRSNKSLKSRQPSTRSKKLHI